MVPIRELSAAADRLLAPLADDAQSVLDVVADLEVMKQKEPTLQYVQFRLPKIDVRGTLGKMPTIGGPWPGNPTYSVLNVRSNAGVTDESSILSTTLLGLHQSRVNSKALQSAFFSAIARVASICLGHEPDPCDVSYPSLSLDDLGEHYRNERFSEPAKLASCVASMFSREPGLWGQTPRSDGTWVFQIRTYSYPFASVLNIEDHVEAVAEMLVVPVRQTPRAVLSPLSLVAAIDHFDLASRLTFKVDRFILWPGAEATAKLALPVGTEDELMSRLSSTGQILKGFQVPGGKGGNGIAKLREHLGSLITSQRIDSAIETLVDVLALRDAFQHDNARAKGLVAWRTLGVEWPISNFEQAWANVQRAVVEALEAIREEMATLT